MKWWKLPLLLPLITCALLQWQFNATWKTVEVAPGLTRSMIAWNDQWPLPTLRAQVGDIVSLTIVNQLDESTSVHIHGLPFTGVSSMDGTEMVSHCPIMPGTQFTYEFEVTQEGTYWYHSHSMSQYGDGLRGLFIVDDPFSPITYDEEVEILLGDYYECRARQCLKQIRQGHFKRMIPDVVLVNDTSDFRWSVKPHTTYLLRLANVAVMAGRWFYIEDHDMTVVEVDGKWTEPYTVSVLNIAPGQRVSVLITTKSSTESNYIIGTAVDKYTMIYRHDQPSFNVTSWMVYNESASTSKEMALIDPSQAYQDYDMKPLPSQRLLGPIDLVIRLEIAVTYREFSAQSSNPGGPGAWHTLNGKTYNAPKVPTLMTAISAPADLKHSPKLYGENTHTYVVKYNQVVEIRIDNTDPMRHPMHLHGHRFQIVSINGRFTSPSNPPQRDTVSVDPYGSVVLRFKSDNPGVWLLHCHLEYHMDQGMGITIVEAPDHISESLGPNHHQLCHQANVPMAGNAGGTIDWHDLSNQPPPLWDTK
ncbi:hypothetical protein DIURU_000619 [Diutina rugosa]|uniref:Laccase n=1 Tax=Diutina rugosa TaxID=5481 RepID=A0A642UX25_DIURU|nr:uncharacterized protein DIURU_000619 [Diutina rugosa]KAA8907299.1 hypothetical protein DIURU_000619 [Diutina rugosa]